MPGPGSASNALADHLQASRPAAAPANSHRQTGRNDARRRYTPDMLTSATFAVGVPMS
jgi:hypothetical protein